MTPPPPADFANFSRREFLRRAAAGAAVASTAGYGVAADDDPFVEAANVIRGDVLVYGATPGGIAAAVAAARLGRRVVLAAHEDHIGGIITNGLTNADIGKKQAVGGLFYEFTRRVVRHYQQQDRDNPAAKNVKLCRDGYFYEASAAEQIFHEMIGDVGPRIELRLRHELKHVNIIDGAVWGVTLENLAQPGERWAGAAKVFIDATYEGDLAAMAKAPYRVGREGRDEYREPHAGRVYTHFGSPDLLPGSTGEADNAIQAFCFRFHVTNDPAKRVPIEKPRDFRREDYHHTLEELRAGRIEKFEQIIQVYPMPNGRFELNSNHPDPKTGVPAQSLDLAEENFSWPEATPAERRKIYERYLSHNVGLLWLLQNDPDTPPKIREAAAQYGWHRDEWTDNGHVPRQVYVRQGRRILGEYVLTERDGEVDPELERTRVQNDSIGVLEFAFDSHACHAYDPSHPGVREGYIFIKHEPLQVPYGVVVPRQVDKLLVPVACSASHVGYNALRMEPVFMALGEACGVAAHLAVERSLLPRWVPTAAIQRVLVERGAVITFYHDLKFDDPAFAAFQFLGARGLNRGYKARADEPVNRRDAWDKLARILRAESMPWTAPQDDPEGPLRSADLVAWLEQAGYRKVAKPAQPDDSPLKLREFATIVYQTVAPRLWQPIPKPT